MPKQHKWSKTWIQSITTVLLLFCGNKNIVASESIDNKSTEQRQEKNNKSIAQVIRLFLDLPKTVAAGGTRSGPPIQPSICLITPTIQPNTSHHIATAIVPEPSIVTGGKLNEFVIRRATGDKKVLYKLNATSNRAIETPLRWPLEPINGGEKFILSFRGEHANMSEKSIVLLQGTSTKILKENEKRMKQVLLQHSSRGAEKALTKLEKNLAIEIAFNSTFHSQKEINQLQSALTKYGCDEQ